MTQSNSNAFRNLDIAILRSFVTITESGSMTGAANRLHMTQSAISMQIKRLESLLGFSVFDRAQRGMQPTPSGDLLMQYAKQMLSLNDEAWGRLTAIDYEGEVSLGVPTDIVHPLIPQVIREFAADFPRINVNLSVSLTKQLLKEFKQGKHDIVLTTESQPAKTGQILRREALVWTGAVDGVAWKKSPLPICFTSSCAFRAEVIEVLKDANIEWTDAVTTLDVFAGFVSVSADLGVSAELACTDMQDRTPIRHEGALPALPDQNIVLYETTSNVKAEEPGGPAHLLGNYLKRVFA